MQVFHMHVEPHDGFGHPFWSFKVARLPGSALAPLLALVHLVRERWRSRRGHAHAARVLSCVDTTRTGARAQGHGWDRHKQGYEYRYWSLHSYHSLPNQRHSPPLQFHAATQVAIQHVGNGTGVLATPAQRALHFLCTLRPDEGPDSPGEPASGEAR